ncbi:MAG TPA: SEC-C metal-binding domain-containing protein, partial [Bacillota bacterium]|nr:SEC-C metal-binding domain-containing protein [Bacillota bacterium]
GTDIILGGNPEFEAKKEMIKEGYDPEIIAYASSLIPTEDDEILKARAEFNIVHEKYKKERADEQQRVRDLGGLCIIGTERHESRRIDNQLRGRSGRQGDPGITQFCISMEDELMRLFGGERMQNVVSRLGVEEDEAIEAGMITRSIESAQKKVEGRNFSIRKYVLQYDNVMNKQREIIYAERRKVLFGEDLKDYIMNMAEELIEGCIKPITVASKYPEEWDLETMNANLKKICNRFKGVAYTEEGSRDLDEEILIEDVLEDFQKLYEEKEKEIGEERMRELERMILIRVVDNKWMDHIDAMDQLKEGIGLRAMGQQDPAGAYAQEGFDMFEEMIEAIKEETVKFCYNVTLQTSSERRRIIGGGEDLKEEYEDDAAYLKDAVEGTDQSYEDTPGQNHKVPERQKNKQQPVKRDMPKVGRNDPCPCGSGKKYKHCCGKDN